MDHALTKQWAMAEQDQRISEVVKRERSRLRNFIRRRVADPSDVEDILQDVFYRLVEANRLLMPDEHREVFVAHELDGQSFKQMAAETGVGVNTLLSRKRNAVLHLRERLRSSYEEFIKGRDRT